MIVIPGQRTSSTRSLVSLLLMTGVKVLVNADIDIAHSSNLLGYQYAG